MLIGFALFAAVACSGCATGFTAPPASVSKTGAELAGGVVTDTGGQIEYWFKWGPTDAYGSETPHQTVTAQQNTLVGVTATIGGLQEATPYHYRLCARDSQQGQGNPSCGGDTSFTTQSVECQQVVTTDVALTGNLYCPAERGLVVGADGVDIDLGGHTLVGPNSISDGLGIENLGHDDVTIRNGRLEKWVGAIAIADASRNRILSISTGEGGNNTIVIGGGAANEIRDSVLEGGRYAVLLVDSDGIVVADNTARRIFSEDGFLIRGAGGSVVRNVVRSEGNPYHGASRGIDLRGSGFHISDNRVSGWSGGNILVAGSDNVVAGNEVFSGHSSSGIFINAFSAGTLVQGNNAHNNGVNGIDVRATATRLQGNSADDNNGLGIDAVAGVTDLGDNTASGNLNPLQCRNVFCAPSP